MKNANDSRPVLLTVPYLRALEKLASAGIGSISTAAKKSFFLRHGLVRRVSNVSGYEVTAKGCASINTSRLFNSK